MLLILARYFKAEMDLNQSNGLNQSHDVKRRKLFLKMETPYLEWKLHIWYNDMQALGPPWNSGISRRELYLCVK